MVYGWLGSGGDITNMMEWVNNYDFVANNVPFNTISSGPDQGPIVIQAYFASASDANPTHVAGIYSNGVNIYSYSVLVSVASGSPPCTQTPLPGGSYPFGLGSSPQVGRAQYLLNPGTNGFIVASGLSMSSSLSGFSTCGQRDWWAQGCKFTIGAGCPYIMDVPIPDTSYFGSDILVQYYLLCILSGGSYHGANVGAWTFPTNEKDMNGTALDYLINGFGPWAASSSPTCYTSPNDPFNDDAP
jgi:hypothetical protein